MPKIDWSKAPKGAEYYHTEAESFYKNESGNNNFYWDEDSCTWERSNAFRDLDLSQQKHFVKRVLWNGEGYPPVGTVCEVRHVISMSWVTYTIIALTTQLVVVVDRQGKEFAITKEDYKFRPIKTPEQIVAEKRELAVIEIIKDLDVSRAKAERAYEKGYRKQN